MIYFLERSDKDIKIGKTVNYHSRLIGLKAEYGELKLLGLVEGYGEEETLLHEKFSHLRIHPRREWFRPAPELFEYIATSATLPIPERVKSDVKMNARVPVTEETQKLLRKFANGLDTNYDEAIRWMLSKYISEGESPLMAGNKIRVEFVKWQLRN